ncbi:MAG: group III truncated hemoglobin [Rhizobiaceae bacterium]
MTDLHARPFLKRESVHPSITVEQISDLVDRFYEQVQLNPKLAPLFAENISGNWQDHLDKMKGFWRSVLLKTGEYKGRPVPVHLKIENIDSADFEEWLQLFSSVSAQVFSDEAAAIINQAARRIATSLWLSRSSDPFASPPHWSRNPQPTNPQTAN